MDNRVGMNTRRGAVATVGRRSISAAGALILSACFSETQAPTEQNLDLSVSARQGGSDYAEERPHRDLARRVPSLGGFFFDRATGNLIVNLTDLSRAASAKGLLRSMLARELAETRKRHPQADVVVRQGTYTFLQLKAWRDRLVPGILDVPGVVWLDLDEANNRIVIGLDQETAATDPAPVREAARNLGVPEEAVDFESSGPFVPQQTLNDTIRPIVGGIQIDARPEATSGPCTLGFTAVWRGKKAFVTASHCSEVWLSPDSTAQYQPTKTPTGVPIGYEVADTSWPCGGDRCSYADASVYSVADNADSTQWVLGRLARTRLGCFGNCYPPAPEIKEISPDHPYFYIDGTQSAWVAGMLVNMIGEESGTLQGNVVRTCIVMRPGGSGFRFECQHQADYGSHAGDSGGPVFYGWNLWPDSTIWLGGIHVGVLQNKAVFSPWSGIVQNFPDLTEVRGTAISATVETHHAPNSFTAMTEERQIRLLATVTPPEYGTEVTWTVEAKPGHFPQPPLPAGPLTGVDVSFAVTPLGPDRWPGDHTVSLTLAPKQLAYRMTATIAASNTSAHVEAVQDEIDTMREEYVELGVFRGVPGRAQFSVQVRIDPGVNTGDYGYRVWNAPFDDALNSLSDSWAGQGQWQLNSQYRNPVHQWVHLQAAQASWHQYGCAADIQTFPVNPTDAADSASAWDFWHRLADLARSQGFGVEDSTQSGIGHVHVQQPC